MKSSKKVIVINHPAEDLYNIVLDVEKYPEFIPWCKELIIKKKNKNELEADMIISYKFFLKKKFTSKVKFDSVKLKINTSYIDGPLKDLKTEWQFDKIYKNKTKVIFKINFEFEKSLHQNLAEILFNLIENKMIESFKKRSDNILN